MVFNTGAALLDAIVLSVVSRDQNGTYGYRYYRITESGRLQLNLYRGEWNTYAQKISRILEEVIRHE